MSQYFNVGAMFILLREALEAALVVGVLLNYVKKTVHHDPAQQRKLRKAVWWGAAAGLAIAIVIGVAITVVFYTLQQDVFDGWAALWEGLLKALAVIFLTWMGFSMLRADNFYDYIEKKLHKKIKKAEEKELGKTATAGTLPAAPVVTAEFDSTDVKENPDAKSDPEAKIGLDPASQTETPAHHDPIPGWTAFTHPPPPPENVPDFKEGFGAKPSALFLIALTVIVREGLESVVFVAGVGGGQPVGLVVGGIVGLIIGLFIGVVIFYGAGRFNLNLFFKLSAFFLFLISAGLAAGAAHELEDYYFAQNPQYGVSETPELWNVCGCCSHKTQPFFQISYALVGWRCSATVATVSAYFGYWGAVLLGWAGMVLYKRRKLRKQAELGATAVSVADVAGVEAA